MLQLNSAPSRSYSSATRAISVEDCPLHRIIDQKLGSPIGVGTRRRSTARTRKCGQHHASDCDLIDLADHEGVVTDLYVRPQIARADKVAPVDLGFDELVDPDGAVPVD